MLGKLMLMLSELAQKLEVYALYQKVLQKMGNFLSKLSCIINRVPFYCTTPTVYTTRHDATQWHVTNNNWICFPWWLNKQDNQNNLQQYHHSPSHAELIINGEIKVVTTCTRAPKLDLIYESCQTAVLLGQHSKATPELSELFFSVTNKEHRS